MYIWIVLLQLLANCVRIQNNYWNYFHKERSVKMLYVLTSSVPQSLSRFDPRYFALNTFTWCNCFGRLIVFHGQLNWYIIFFFYLQAKMLVRLYKFRGIRGVSWLRSCEINLITADADAFGVTANSVRPYNVCFVQTLRSAFMVLSGCSSS